VKPRELIILSLIALVVVAGLVGFTKLPDPRCDDVDETVQLHPGDEKSHGRALGHDKQRGRADADEVAC